MIHTIGSVKQCCGAGTAAAKKQRDAAAAPDGSCAEWIKK
jgi:hypothetical protein